MLNNSLNKKNLRNIISVIFSAGSIIGLNANALNLKNQNLSNKLIVGYVEGWQKSNKNIVKQALEHKYNTLVLINCAMH